MDIRFDYENEFKGIFLSDFFIENYMSKKNAFYCIVYIYVYKKYCAHEKDISIESLALKFNVAEQEIVDCFDYWRQKKLIDYDDRENNLCIKFMMLDLNSNINIKDKFDLEYKNKKMNHKMDAETRNLFDFAKNMLGRYLDYNDVRILLNLHDNLCLPFDVIKFLISYCVRNGKKNIGYIEKVGIDWANNEIFSLQEAKNQIDNMNDFFRDVKKALAASKLNLEQRKMILDWHENLGMEKNLIIKACNITMLKICTPNFNYLEKIILSWYRNNIRTLDDFEKFISDKKDDNNSNKKFFGFKNGKKKLAEFEYKQWNFDDVKKIINKTSDDSGNES